MPTAENTVAKDKTAGSGSSSSSGGSVKNGQAVSSAEEAGGMIGWFSGGVSTDVRGLLCKLGIFGNFYWAGLRF